jgi:CBS domain-containing protein
MAVERFCRRPACAVAAGTRVRAAAERLEKERVGSLVVTANDRPTAVVTDRDIVLRVLAEGRDPAETRVEEIVAGPVVAVAEDTPLAEATAAMRRHRVRRLPVVDERGALVGLLAADDVVPLVAQELGALADVACEQVPSAGRPAPGSASRSARHYARPVATVGLDATARQVAQRMRADAVGSVVVVDADGAPCGLVTDRDLSGRVVAAGLDPAAATAASFMSPSPVTTDAADRLQKVASLMSDHGVRRVPVVDGGRLVGIVTYDDLLVALGNELHDLGQAAQGAVARERLAWRTGELRSDLERVVRELAGEVERLEEEARAAIGHELRALGDRLRRA